MLEQGYTEFAKRPENAGIYADPSTGAGATVEQVWLFFTTLGILPYCLLAYPLPEDQTNRITRLIRYTPEQVVAALKKIQSAVGSIDATTLHYDGTTGHCISIISYDEERDRFIYSDPWPLKSLLCKENNMANVDAQTEEGNRWSVTAKELESVIFASLVFPEQWARAQGVEFDLKFDEWREGDFFKFFHLKQATELMAKGIHRRTFSVGPFEQEISLAVECNQSGKILDSVLLLNSVWKAKNFVLVLDLVKSYVVAFAPRPDEASYEELSSNLWNLRDPDFVTSVKARDPKESTITQCLHAFLGMVETASMRTDFADLAFRNLAVKQVPAQEIGFALT
jgi:hypothetical protein